MKYKIREPKKLISIFLIIYIILSVVLIANNFSKRNKELPREITGNSVGAIKIFLGNATEEIPTACIAPTSPTLNPIGNKRVNLITMTWTTYKNSAQFDQFVFDGEGLVTANSPQSKSRLNIGEHTWKVRTCNAECCSEYSSDTFRILPSYPIPTGVAVGTVPPEEEVIKAPEVRTPSSGKISVEDITQNLLRIAYLVLTLGITFITISILLKRHIFFGEKEIRHKKLAEYILAALKKGFTEPEIRTKLKSSNTAEEEIEYVFKKIKSKNSIPKEK